MSCLMISKAGSPLSLRVGTGINDCVVADSLPTRIRYGYTGYRRGLTGLESRLQRVFVPASQTTLPLTINSTIEVCSPAVFPPLTH